MGRPKSKTVGNITMVQAVKVARMKQDSLLGKTLKLRVKEIISTCVSMGITIEGKNPKEIIKDVEAGFYNDLLVEK